MSEPKAVERYEHPQGGVIVIYDDDSMDARDHRGKRKKTSATPDKLRAGHGRWVQTWTAETEST